MMGNPPAILRSSLDSTEPAEHSPSGSLSINAWEFQAAMRRSQQRRLKRNCSRRPEIGMKRRVVLRGCSRPVAMGELERKLQVLQGLVPDGDCMSLDGLFRRTADYIMCLEMQVKVMQVMVEVLTDSSA